MVTGIILAAGRGRRMGEPKQLLPLGGKPLVYHAAAAACQASFDKIIVITGAYEAAVTQVLQGLPVHIIYNENWAQGQSTSVIKAVHSLGNETQAAMFLLADQPLVEAGLVNKLIEAYQETKASIIMPRCHGQYGNPVLFDMSVWRSALLQLSGDEGARQIIRQHQDTVFYVEISNGQVFLDVDTPSDYDQIKQLWQEGKKTTYNASL